MTLLWCNIAIHSPCLKEARHGVSCDHMENLRNSHTARMWIIGALIIIAAIALFFVKGTWAKVVIGVIIALLLGALGMEVAQTDYDLGTLAKTGSFSAAKIERDESGNLLPASVDAYCNASEKDYNCPDFRTQPEAQQVYDRCKALGQNMDVYRLDGDKDGLVCESLPKAAR
ncbi:hypothetical protein FJY94_00955 [Candidatus Kaiserbacteria bacterium]|nr:hypothetical protein [Candidatus Kaiserbacteria bacterium]